MTFSTVLRCSLLALSLAPGACTFPVKAGDSPDDPQGDDAPADDPTGAPAEPAVDEPGDGAQVGAVEWTYRSADPPFANAVAVGPAGRIVVVGDGIVLAIDPDGTELWRKTMDSHAFTSVEIDEQGTIYLAGEVGTMHAVSPNGDELWGSDVGLDFQGLALGHGALYSLDSVAGGAFDTFVVRRHDRTSGAVEWARNSPDGLGAYCNDLAVAGPHVVVAGLGRAVPGDPSFPLLAAYDELGALQSFELGDEQDRLWEAAAAVGDGGLALAGRGLEADRVVRRLGADLSQQWTIDEGGPGAASFAIAGRPTGALAFVGHNVAENTAFVRRLDAGGATVWSAPFVADGADGDTPTAVAFGPGFLVALGITRADGTYAGIWVRRHAD